MFAELTAEQIEYVAGSIKEYMGGERGLKLEGTEAKERNRFFVLPQLCLRSFYLLRLV